MSYIEKGSPEYRRAIVVLFLGSIVAFGAEYCLQPVIPVIAEEFSLTPAKASLAMSFGTGGMAFAMLLIAGLAKRLARKTTMAVAITGASLLMLIMAASESFGLILLLRLCQGVLLAGFPALAIAYINEEFNGKILGFVMGIYVSGTSLGGLTGRLLISAGTDFFSWRYAVMAAGAAYLAIGILFYLWLPEPRHPLAHNRDKITFLGDMTKMLQNRRLLGIYAITFAVMGAFVCTYNYISYVFMAEPYNLSQTAIGFIFSLYLVGTVASAVMGKLSDTHGNGKILCLSIFLMLAGILVSMCLPLAIKILGLAMFTYGFFAAHATACSWAGKVAEGDKAQVSSLYMLFYYIGASVLGTAGGVFLSSYGWNGVVFFVAGITGAALFIAVRLAAGTPRQEGGRA